MGDDSGSRITQRDQVLYLLFELEQSLARCPLSASDSATIQVRLIRLMAAIKGAPRSGGNQTPAARQPARE